MLASQPASVCPERPPNSQFKLGAKTKLLHAFAPYIHIYYIRSVCLRLKCGNIAQTYTYTQFRNVLQSHICEACMKCAAVQRVRWLAQSCYKNTHSHHLYIAPTSYSPPLYTYFRVVLNSWPVLVARNITHYTLQC